MGWDKKVMTVKILFSPLPLFFFLSLLRSRPMTVILSGFEMGGGDCKFSLGDGQGSTQLVVVAVTSSHNLHYSEHCINTRIKLLSQEDLGSVSLCHELSRISINGVRGRWVGSTGIFRPF